MRMISKHLVLLATLFAGQASGEAPPLGSWEVLFAADDGRAVALDVYRETPLIVDGQGGVYYLNEEVALEQQGQYFGDVYANWQKVAGSGRGIDISVDGDGVPWVVERGSGRVLFLDGNFYGPDRGWLEYPGQVRARRVAVSKLTGEPYAIDMHSGQVLKGTGNGWVALSNVIVGADGQQLAVAFNAIEIYVDAYDFGTAEKPSWQDRLFAINQDHRLFQYQPKDKRWQELPGDIRAWAVAASGRLVYVVGKDGAFYGLDWPSGTRWTAAGGGSGRDLAYTEIEEFHPFVRRGGKEVPATSFRYLWTIGPEGKIMRAFVAH